MNQINLLPLGYQKRQRRKYYLIIGALTSLIGSLTLMGLLLIPTLKIHAAQEEYEALSKVLASQEVLETRSLLKESIKAKEQNAKAAKILDELDQPNHISRQTMDVLTASVPKGLRINRMIMLKQDKSITIEGQAQEISQIAQYMVELSNTGQFEIIDYRATPNQESAWTDYSLLIQPRNLIDPEERDEINRENYEDEFEEEEEEDIW